MNRFRFERSMAAKEYGVMNTDGQAQKLTQNEWLAGAVSGDAEAFDALLDTLLPVMFRQAMKVIGDVRDAEDVVQEASLRIFRAIKTFKGQASIQTWATRITLNCCYELFRKRKNDKVIPLEFETEEGSVNRTPEDRSPNPLDLLESKETIAAVRRAALGLKEPFKTTLIRIDLLQHTYKEVASYMGVPVGTVKSRLSRARAMAGAAIKKAMEPKTNKERQTDKAGAKTRKGVDRDG